MDAEEKKKLNKERNLKKRGVRYRPPAGKVWNPLTGFPRNEPCFCESGKKFKKCCIEKVLPCVPPEDAERANEIMKAMGFK